MTVLLSALQGGVGLSSSSSLWERLEDENDYSQGQNFITSNMFQRGVITMKP